MRPVAATQRIGTATITTELTHHSGWENDMYDETSGFRPDASQDSSPWGRLIMLVAIFAMLFLGIYFFSPQSGTHTAQNGPSATVPTTPAPSPGPGKM